LSGKEACEIIKFVGNAVSSRQAEDKAAGEIKITAAAHERAELGKALRI
jgi:hypothetical protein